MKGAFNMEYDETHARTLVAGGGFSVLRIYGWNPPAISLGYHQSLDEIDVQKCKEAGLDIVRRPTGGRAILHSDEVTYTVVMVAPRSNVLSVYNQISEALVCGLRKLGVAVTLAKSQPHFPSLYRTSSATVCFTSSARYEIQVDGKKLVGSAQRRFARNEQEDVVLQHGSILLGADHKRITEFLNIKDEQARVQISKELDEKTCDLSSVMGRTVTFEEVAGAVKEGFGEAWGITFDNFTVRLSNM
jgi:lipoate-protein ligase A